MIRNPFKRAVSIPVDVVRAADLAPGEKVLAGTQAADGTWLLGTRAALAVVPPSARSRRLPWERVEHADWDRDEEQFVVVEVGEFGRVRPRHVFTVADPGVLLELVRERVTASVVIQRRVRVHGTRGLTVIARRSPVGDGELGWAYQLDPGVDPEDPTVAAAAEEGLRAAQEELGGV